MQLCTLPRPLYKQRSLWCRSAHRPWPILHGLIKEMPEQGLDHPPLLQQRPAEPRQQLRSHTGSRFSAQATQLQASSTARCSAASLDNRQSSIIQDSLCREMHKQTCCTHGHAPLCPRETESPVSTLNPPQALSTCARQLQNSGENPWNKLQNKPAHTFQAHAPLCARAQGHEDQPLSPLYTDPLRVCCLTAVDTACHHTAEQMHAEPQVTQVQLEPQHKPHPPSTRTVLHRTALHSRQHVSTVLQPPCQALLLAEQGEQKQRTGKLQC